MSNYTVHKSGARSRSAKSLINSSSIREKMEKTARAVSTSTINSGVIDVTMYDFLYVWNTKTQGDLNFPYPGSLQKNVIPEPD